jgi:predicted MFS family arabinose efflux permease
MIMRLVGILFSTYMLLWIQSFVNTGYLEAEDDALRIFRKVMMISMVGNLVVLPLVGWLSDTVRSAILIPFAYALRFVACMAFTHLEVPDSTSAYISCTFLILATQLENVSVEVLFMRDMPGDIRGILNALLHFSGQIGILFYSQVGGRLFDSMGPAAPFWLLGIMDIVVGGLALILGLLGKFEAKSN